MVLDMTDGASDAPLLRKDIEGITFPLTDLELIYADGVLMLPSEQ